MNKLPRIALISGLLTLGLFCGATRSRAQNDSKVTTLPDGYTRLASGLEYKIIVHGKGKKKPEVSDHLELNISYQVHDSVLFDSRKMNNNKPVPIPCGKPRGAGDPAEVFMLMVAGDSAVVRFPVDLLKKTNNVPPFAKDGDMLEYHISLVSVKTDAEDKKENAEKAAKQLVIDDKILQDYFKKNNLKPKKTASGLYYTIHTEGKGEKIKAGDNIGVNYTGMFMDGKKFDSNTDSAFHHMQPFVLEVGRGKVIKGWDEGLQLLKKNSKATFYIPSVLAYGSQDRGPQIPANSILLFDVEIIDMPDQAKVDDSVIVSYLAKNNIKATKTPSGLYYTITQKGLGPNAKPGKKVTMNYTGKTVDGKIFDSNTDPKFNHVQPFTFSLGQGQVIKGWDEGVQLLNLGSKGAFFIPSGLGYGAQGAGKDIPGNAVLIFDVELTGIDN